MASASAGDVGRHLRQLFATGSGVGLSDGQLLERYATAGRDSAEAAFETILARHGATVLSVCRQVLDDGHAAEDAFQATFLVLVRRADSLHVRDNGSLGAWLHGVAYRTALKARKGVMRRRAREHRVARREAWTGLAVTAVEQDDMGAALHAEVTRLPAKYRAPVVLCYFEGRTHDEAAAALNWPVGTVRCRLSRARDLLRTRLTRRGLAPAVAAIGAKWPVPAARAEVPSPLLRATLEAAVGGAPAAAGAQALTGLALRGLFAARLRIAAAAVLGLVAMAAGLAYVVSVAMASLPEPRSPDTAVATVPVAAIEPLPAHARVRLGTPAFRHGGMVGQILSTRDGKTLVTVDHHRVVGIWDAATGRLRHQIALSGYPFDRVALSPDGTTLATTESHPDTPLRLWDVATGRERRRWHLPRNYACSSPAFTPDGRTLITLSNRYDETSQRSQSYADLWDLTTPGEYRRRVPLEGQVDGGMVSPDARTLATVRPLVMERGQLVVHDGLEGWAVLNGNLSGHAIRLLDLATGRARHVLRFESDYPRSLAYSPDSRYLAAALLGPMVRVYDTSNGRERLPRFGFKPPVGPPPPYWSPSFNSWLEVFNPLTFSPDGSILAAGSCQSVQFPSPGSLHLWDFATGRPLRRIDGPRDGPFGLAFSPDGRTIASVDCSEAVVRRWDVATGREDFPQPGHVMGISALALSPADGTVVTGSFDGTIRRWDLATGQELGLIGRLHCVSTLAIAPDGRTLIVGGGSGELVLWSVAERREIRRFSRAPRTWPAEQATFSPDGRSVACERRVWDVATGRSLAVLRGRDEPEDAVAYPSGFFYTPDGRRAITVDYRVVRTWDVASWTELGPPLRNDRFLAMVGFNFALSDDGRLLAIGGVPRAKGVMGPPDTLVRVWELASGREVAQFPGYDDSWTELAFSPDGRLLAMFRSRTETQRDPGQSYHQDAAIRLLDVASGREVRRLEGHRGAVNAVVFTRDGRSLISAGEDATALVWDVSDLWER